MTSDNKCNEFFIRQHYGRQSLDGSKINMDQKKQIWRSRKLETASKSEENLSDCNRKVEKIHEHVVSLSDVCNSFKDSEKLNKYLPKTFNAYSTKKSESCDYVNRERRSVKVVSYLGPPPNSVLAPTNYHPYIPVSVDITTERPTSYIQKTALTMEPVSSSYQLHSRKSLRPFTSVNLILRSPSSEPQSPIDIAMQGSSITYSTFSADPKLGYESQLEINFGPPGQNSVSSSRLEPLSSLRINENLNPSTQLVIREQIKRKQKLEEVLQSEVRQLLKINEDIDRMKHYLFLSQSTPKKLVQLKEDIIFLRGECAKWTTEVDLASNEQVPLGETNEDFYKDICHESDSSSVRRNQCVSGQSQNYEEVGWTCHMCTFINYPMLPKCEQCEMPRLDFETSITASTSSCPCPPHATAIKSNVMS